MKGITHWMGITGTFCESCGQEDSELREGSLAFVLRPFCMDANYSIQFKLSCSLWMRGKFSHPSLHLLAEYCTWLPELIRATACCCWFDCKNLLGDLHGERSLSDKQVDAFVFCSCAPINKLDEHHGSLCHGNLHEVIGKWQKKITPEFFLPN